MLKTAFEAPDGNEPPEINSGSRTEFNYRENATASLYTYTATDPEGADIAWSLTGADAGDFTINENGVLSFASPPDYENPADAGSDNVYNVTVVATDDRGLTDELEVTVTVTDQNEGPEVSGPASLSFTENQTTDRVLATYSATDPEGTDISWSLTGTDAGDFRINENGELSFRNIPDHEKPADSGRDNVYNFSVRASDGRYYGYLEVTVTVEDVNEPPTITTISGSATELSQNENRTSRLYTYRATDPEGGTIAWSVGGIDSRFFTIDERGQFSFRETSPPNFEQPGDSGGDNVYEVEIEASDGSNTDSLAVRVTVREVNEGPEVSGQESLSFTENQTTERILARYSATDPEDPSATITRWSLSGTDGGDFTITENGELSFRNVPDYDKPADSGKDNVYNFSVRASDGRYYGYLPVTVTVADVNEAPEITTISGSATELSQNENQTSRLYTYRATDPEGETIIWTVGGVDGRFFAIDERGQFFFSEINPPNFERPGDSGGDNVYEVEIEASDGANADSLAVEVTVREVNEGPEVSGQESLSFTENQTTERILARYSATDPEDPSATITRWSLSGSDGGDFTINENGELSFRNVPDYDKPADSGKDNVYNFSVRASDGRYYGYLPVTVTVEDVNEAPEITTISGSATELSQNENQTSRLYTYRATDPEGGTVTWSVGGVDDRFFAIDERGQFFFSESNPPNFEQPGDSGGNNVYEVEIEASDGANTDSLAVRVTVREVNEGPEVSGQESLSFTENQTTERILARYSATDPEDPSATITRWSLSGSDGGDFTINENGELSFRNVPDYDKPADSGKDNVYNFSVRASDGRYYGYLPVTVTVADVNEAPEITTISGSATELSQNENQTSRLYTYRATDPEGGTITWTVGGVDDRFFAIDERGQFFFSETNPPNFEQPGDLGGNNVYEVEIEASDGANTDSLAVRVTVREVNEGPEVSGPASFTIAENQSLSNAAYTATDPEGGNVARWNVGGRDGGDFFITQGGTLYFRSPPDYERPADSNKDNVYEVQIRPSDGRHYGAFDVTVTVTGVDEPPEIRSGSRTSFTQPENRTSRLYTYSATDPERGTVTWSVAGTDRRHFAIDERGQLSFDENNPPDFDAPGDVSGDNIYHVTVEARDDQFNTANLPVIVTVTPVDEAPVITRQGNAPGSVLENHAVTQVLARYTASDPERPSVGVTRWSTAGRDGGDFVINALGELRFRKSPDYERPDDANRDNVYEVAIRASDGRYTGILEDVQTVTVTDDNEPPTITTTSRTAFSQAENRTSSLYTFRATDPEGEAVTWTAAGTDGSAFTIDEGGRFSFDENNPPDFDTPGDADGDNVYLVRVQARDAASNTASLEVTVTVTNNSEGVEPTISTRRPPATYRENGPSAVYTFRASDPQRGDITWRVTGTDSSAFTITRDSSGRGILAFVSPPDFESPADGNRDNEYELAVVATDDGGHTDRVAFTITVTDHNEGVEPTISTRRPPSTYRENNTSPVYTFRASDPQRGDIRWSLTGTDADDFAIVSDSSGRGILSFDDPPDVENAVDSNQDNAYELTVVATDDDNHTDRVAFTIAVTDVNEGPEIRLEGTATTSVPENEPDTQVLAKYTATDPENPTAGIFRWRTVGRDSGDFVINELGELRFRSSPDYERPADANRDNIYEVTVQASDGRSYGMLAETLIVTVRAVNEAPVITTTSRTAFTLRENSTAVLYTYRATDQDDDDVITWSVGGTDGEVFAIYNGILSFRLLPDFEIPVDADEDNVYEITVVADDGAGLQDTVNAVITITDQPEGPVIAGRTSFTVTENSDIAQVLGVYAATDAKDNRPVFPRWSLSGRDGGDFVIDGVSGTLALRNTPDYDRPADANRDNIYEVTIRAHDGVATGNLNVTVNVTNVNEAPSITTISRSATELGQNESQTSRLYTYRATDPEGGTIFWSVGGVDGRFFAIDERGQFAFGATSPPDFEQPGDAGGNNVYEVEIEASDGINTGSLAVTVTVRAVNEGPEVSGQSTFTIDENQSLSNAVYTATDPEGDTVTRWTVGGRDGGDFTITETGVLTFRNVPDYDKPADSNRDNVYEVQIRPYDGRHYGAYDVTVTVTDVNEAPTITTISRSATELSQNENRTSRLYTYRATDPEGSPITWTVGGVDRRFFAIDDRGRFSFSASTPPDFEQPGDAGGNNVYEVEIEASDGLNTGSLAVTVTVRAVDEGPVVSGTATFTIGENQNLTGATFTGRDPEVPDAEVTNWRLSGSDAGDFTITDTSQQTGRNTAELTFRNIPDFDRPADSNRDNEYVVTIRAYNGSTYGSLDVTVTVTDQNEAEPVVSGRDSLRVSENYDRTLATYDARDMDRGTTFAWSVRGADGREFAISDSGALTFARNPNYERPADLDSDNVYEITIVASDGANEGSLGVSITVTDVNEGPEITGQGSHTVSESFDEVLDTYSATDPEDATAEITRWSVTGRDGGDFTINEAGELTFRKPPDFERPADSNRDNEYEVTVRASDGRVNGTFGVTVVVEDVNEAPEFRSGSKTSFTYRENGTSALYTYRATDPEQGAVSWSLRGDDAGDFLIGETGSLTFASPPDFDRPAGSGVDGNDYLVTVVVTDDGTYGSEGQLTGTRLERTLEVTVTVSDVNEGPEIDETSTNTAITVRENHDQVLSTYSATDPEDPGAEITRWSLSGRDGGDFTINEAGALSFRNPPDVERPADSNRDNTYEVSVRASDGRYYGTLNVTVTVEAVDEAPEFRRGSQDAFAYQENETSAIYTYRATDPEGSDVTWGLAGIDRSAFTMSAAGVLSFNSPPDYESPADSGSNNVFELTVEARDENNNTAGLAVTVTVTNVTDVGVPSNVRVTRHESGQLRVFWKAPDSGTPPDGYTVQWKESGADWTDDADVSEEPVTDTSHIIKGLTDGVEYTVRVIASTDDTDSAPSKEASAAPEETAPPTLSSATVDGAVLTITFNEALDSGEAPGKSAFAVPVAGSSRGVDTVAVSGSVVTITLATAAFAGDAVTVDYTAPTDGSVARLQDLAGNAAASFSEQNVSNNTRAADQMTATVSAVPDSHNGDFTFEIRLSEAPHAGFSDTTMRDHAFTVTGGVVTKARQLAPPSNIGWEIHVTPDGDAAVTIALPVTTDCTAQGAICTGDRRPVSNRLEVTVPGPVSQPASQENTPATGAPTISGTAQVGETLTASTTEIADADGLASATFSYQWLADEADIGGATGSSFALTDAEAGKAIRVRVSFTDDAGHAETVTSAATAAVAAAGAQPKSATVDGSTLTLTYEENLDEGVTLPASAFTVTVNSGGRAVNGVSVSGTTVDLTLASAVAAGETVKVGYAKPDGPNFIRDTLGREGDSFGDHAVTNNTPEALPQQQEVVNTPATGAPTVTGTAKLGEALTADTSGIADEDGLDNATFSYQWVRVDGRTETDIPSAVAPAYHPTTEDVGKTIKVNVSFTDDAGHSEGPLGSAVTDVVEDSDRVQVLWTATMTTAAETVDPADRGSGDPAKIGYGDPSTYPESSLVPSTFVVGSTTYTFREVAVDSADLVVHISPQLSATDVANWRFLAGATEFTPGTPVNEPDLDYSLLRWVEADLHWNAGDRIALAIRVVNNAATGAPSVTGTAQVGETLTADLSGITDADGKPSDAQGFGYQWVRVDGRTATEIAGARAPRYSLADADVGKTIKVTVSFTDMAGFSEGPLTSDATDPVTPKPSSPATGQPTISGTAQVGETLTANTSGIADADGLDDATFSYQWIADDSDIAGATGSTYTLAAADEGKVVKVRVSFTDDAGHAETLTSTATVAVAAKPSSPATGQPAITGTAQVGETLTADTSGIADADGLDNVSFSYQWIADDSDIAGATGSTYTLAAADEGKAVKVRVSFTDDAGHAETLTSTATVAVAAKPSSPATGQPAITGTVQVGETLTADTSGIADADGLDDATFSYQWIADDSDIAGATGSTYTLAAADEGKVVKVRVRFTDDRGHAETLTSTATVAVAAKPSSPATGQPAITGTVQVGETLTANTSGIADADGLDNVSFSYQWIADDSDIAGATGSTYTLAAADEGKVVTVRVSFTDDRGHAETLTSTATVAVAAKPSSPATGQPAITGTVQVGETLTADTSGIADADGLGNVSFSYQWIADDSDIAGATGSTYALAAADEGKAVKVRVSFTDDAGNAESLTSGATDAVAGLPSSPLTARLENTPQSHDGQTTFTFELRFSEHLADLSYITLRDDAFTVTGGQVTKARRMDPDSDARNIHWEISVTPDGNGAVTIVLPATTDCDDSGAVCTSDGRMLSTRLELAVSGPGG